MDYLIGVGVVYGVLCLAAVYFLFKADSKYKDDIQEGDEEE